MSTSTAAGVDPRFTRHILAAEDAFVRADEAPDANFYSAERMVEHLDATALKTVESLVESLVTEEAPVILDLMASWDSHIPESLSPSRVAGLGLNQPELDANPVLTDRIVQDLNADPTLPFGDDTFDLVLNVVSVEYLTDPGEVFREVARVLKPGGLFLVVFSNRWFPPKVVRVWEDSSEHERIGLVEEFFREGGAFTDPELFVSMGLPRPEDDRYHETGVPSDPVFALFAEKEGGAPGRPRRTPPDETAVEAADPDMVAARKRRVGETLACPHCRESLSKWEVPDDPIIDWPNEYMYLCFNDACPFVVRGWRFMWEQGIEGHSYRYLFNPLTGASTTVPIQTLQDLRLGIMREE
ncbi:MAG: class I SAM-dependent methyltransferase [Longimicrobiales bacterium]